MICPVCQGLGGGDAAIGAHPGRLVEHVSCTACGGGGIARPLRWAVGDPVRARRAMNAAVRALNKFPGIKPAKKAATAARRK